MAERSQRCTSLRERLCAELGEHTRACKLARQRTQTLTPEACRELSSHYAAVRDELANAPYKRRVSPAAQEQLMAAGAPARGPSSAKLQLVEFLDYENAYSAQAEPVLRALIAKHGDDLHLVIRMRPLAEDPHARASAEAALAAHAQGKFWPMHALLLANQGELTRPALERFAAQLQLDMRAFRAALDQHTYAAAVDADLALAAELDVTAMPAMFLNGERILNTVDAELLSDAAEEYLARP